MLRCYNKNALLVKQGILNTWKKGEALEVIA